ncbi:CDF family Co(II)/Ni(II) efflux transporter DmeF [Stenotrophomonas sp.]|uniref:CDF family Co(II)/Ni(II) efflux transporter DmeF n=1 Tax=Stenotrophomonas sp. TaxID=69392 RepID=UPI0028AA3274|nr:CDF family Co(II)/Ni(II) efflux transporter DmeF [Stenotrophomonas sp.]
MNKSTTPIHPARTHTHQFGTGNPLAELNTGRAFRLTAVMMIVEILGGWWYNSMAVLADGWHMSSHALALGLSAFAYSFARKHASNPRFTFGTWKVEVLGGYTSAILLLGVAGIMAFESVNRLLAPTEIHYNQAIVIAFVGLAVNLICAWLLRDNHDHGHGHGHTEQHASDNDHNHGGHAHDLNLRSAYIHVMADAATSVLAVVALFGGKLWGASWLDPVMGIAGALLVTAWAIGLLRDSGKVLLDAEMDAGVVDEVREVISESHISTQIEDIHVWRVGRNHYACILALVTEQPVSVDYFKDALSIHEELVHVTIEIRFKS